MGLEVEIDGDGESGRAGRGAAEEREWRNLGRGSSLAAGMGGSGDGRWKVKFEERGL